MAAKGLIVLVCLLVLLSPTQASPRPPCCERYTRSRVPFQQIIGFKVQSIYEHCRINAIILITKKQKEICADENEKWVGIILKKLSEELEKMSKSGDGKIPVMTNRKRPILDGSGHFYNTTEHTGHYY